MALIQMGAYLDATSAPRLDDFLARYLLLAREWKRSGLGTRGGHRISRDFGHQKNRSHRELSVESILWRRFSEERLRPPCD
jgi:hypothetical protein